MQESLIPYIECLGLEFYFKSYMFGCETSRKWRFIRISQRIRNIPAGHCCWVREHRNIYKTNLEDIYINIHDWYPVEIHCNRTPLKSIEILLDLDSKIQRDLFKHIIANWFLTLRWINVPGIFFLFPSFSDMPMMWQSDQATEVQNRLKKLDKLIGLHGSGSTISAPTVTMICNQP